MATLQVKGLDDELYRALGARAAMDHRSVSQEVVVIIKDYLAHTKPDAETATHSLLDLAGSWEDARTPAALARDLRTARRKRRTGKAGDVFA